MTWEVLLHSWHWWYEFSNTCAHRKNVLKVCQYLTTKSSALVSPDDCYNCRLGNYVKNWAKICLHVYWRNVVNDLPPTWRIRLSNFSPGYFFALERIIQNIIIRCRVFGSMTDIIVTLKISDFVWSIEEHFQEKY